MLGADGELVAQVRGPVWRDLPQTPQAGEYCAYAAATHFILGMAKVYGDCLDVVRDAQGPLSSAVQGNRPHAGIMRDTVKWLGADLIEAVGKVKAHVVSPGLEHTIADPKERRRAVGSSLADRVAFKGMETHGALSPDARKDLQVCPRAARHHCGDHCSHGLLVAVGVQVLLLSPLVWCRQV